MLLLFEATMYRPDRRWHYYAERGFFIIIVLSLRADTTITTQNHIAFSAIFHRKIKQSTGNLVIGLYCTSGEKHFQKKKPFRFK